MKGSGVCFLCWICLLAGCKGSLIDRSLIFATHTTLGLEVSVNPAETGSPAKIIIGFKRSEGVLNPVYDSEGTEIVKDTANDMTRISKYRPEAYSVIAKLAGEIRGSAKTEGAVVCGSQWFAIGEAANRIANHEAFAAMMTDNPQIAEKARQIAMEGASAERKVKLEAEELKEPLHEKYIELRNDEKGMRDFDDVVKLEAGFANFKSFDLGNPTSEQVIAVRKALEFKGYKFDSQ